MVAERINLPAIEHARDVLDDEEKRLAGEVVVTIGFTNAAVKDLAPREHEELAAYLFALLEREPVKSSSPYAAHRIVLGSLATELRGFAAAAGEPVGLQADLRAASTQAEERRIRERLDGQRAAATRYYDDVVMDHHRGRDDDTHIPDEPDQEEIEEVPAATLPTEDDDADLAFL